MEQYLTLLASGLYQIVCTRYNRELKEAKFIIAILIQAARDLHRKDSLDEDRRDAIRYLQSDTFLYHCKLLALDDNVTRHLLTRTPKLNRKTVLPGTES